MAAPDPPAHTRVMAVPPLATDGFQAFTAEHAGLLALLLLGAVVLGRVALRQRADDPVRFRRRFALLIPVYRMFRSIEVPFWFSESGTLLNSYWGLIAVNVAFQTGFCAFVLSNYMKTLPRELYESAVVDGAGVLRQFFQLTLPLCRPPLAALATLEVTWIYNEFFWATVLLQSGDKFPVTSSLNNLRGQFFTDNNLVAAGSVVVALPTLIIFFVLQKQFVAGLTLGATKG